MEPEGVAAIIAAIGTAVAGIVAVWRRSRGGDDGEPEEDDRVTRGELQALLDRIEDLVRANDAYRVRELAKDRRISDLEHEVQALKDRTNHLEGQSALLLELLQLSHRSSRDPR